MNELDLQILKEAIEVLRNYQNLLRVEEAIVIMEYIVKYSDK